MTEKILLGHGSGGKLTQELIREVFIKHFSNPALDVQSDASVLEMGDSYFAFTTDSFVVDPVFFPGGDIGKLAVAGTVNDVAVSGAEPLYISCGFIIEEGFPLEDLKTIVASMEKEAKKAGVAIVTGDTKVVDRGKCDKVFINTSGIGLLPQKYQHISAGNRIRPGDKILTNGTIGDHGIAILCARESLNIKTKIESDCASLNGLIKGILDVCPEVRFMRDATRGGVATVLTELTERRDFGIEIDEEAVPVDEQVRGMCELLGFDPMYVANEGKVVVVAPGADADKILNCMKGHELGNKSRIIGEIVEDHPGKGWIKTSIGGRRILDMLAGEQLPRIC